MSSDCRRRRLRRRRPKSELINAATRSSLGWLGWLRSIARAPLGVDEFRLQTTAASPTPPEI
jgi:hypothetical protein